MIRLLAIAHDAAMKIAHLFSASPPTGAPPIPADLPPFVVGVMNRSPGAHYPDLYASIAKFPGASTVICTLGAWGDWTFALQTFFLECPAAQMVTAAYPRLMSFADESLIGLVIHGSVQLDAALSDFRLAVSVNGDPTAIAAEKAYQAELAKSGNPILAQQARLAILGVHVQQGVPDPAYGHHTKPSDGS